ncbi:MAG TPA: DUF1707 domain-containing protein, partial [Gaiellaceae bacterium]|nr:DUF1707 domain-containing protein [Gaiellaceae bacterium]
MDELSARASDADREHAVAALREQVLDGRLTLEEFSERVRAAYLLREQDDLAALTGPLPALPTRRRASRLTLALLAHVVRRGRLRLPRRAIVVSGFSDVDIDLREAEIAHAETDVHLLVAFGNVDVY